MGRIERIIVLWTFADMVAYVPFFAVAVHVLPAERSFAVIMPPHLLGLAQNIIALILTIRDLYKRPFPRENQKLTWLLLILLTVPIGWVLYIFKYALKPRPSREDTVVDSHDLDRITDDMS